MTGTCQREGGRESQRDFRIENLVPVGQRQLSTDPIRMALSRAPSCLLFEANRQGGKLLTQRIITHICLLKRSFWAFPEEHL